VIKIPNWCYNTLDVSGSKEDLEEFKRKVSSKNQKLDFRKIIPYDRNQRKQSKIEWKQYLEQNKENKNDFYNSFEQYWFNHGGYEWCINNWGTKWKACSTTLDKSKNMLKYSFDTAWAPPIPVINEIIRRFPKLVFYLFYEELGMMFQGEIFKAENGQYIHDDCNLEGAYCPECKEDGWAVKSVGNKELFVCPDCGKEFSKEQAWNNPDEVVN